MIEVHECQQEEAEDAVPFSQPISLMAARLSRDCDTTGSDR